MLALFRCRAALAALIVVAACASPRPDAPLATGVARISGKMIAVHPASSRLELSDAGRRFSVRYTPETLVKSGTVELAVADLRPGDRLVVSLSGDDSARARLISLAGPIRHPLPSGSGGEKKEDRR